MYIVNVVVGEHILDRSIFWTLKEASQHAQEITNHKVWSIGPGQVYFGNVEARVYEPNLYETVDYKDEHILSFVEPLRDSTNVLWSTCCQNPIRNMSDALYGVAFF